MLKLEKLLTELHQWATSEAPIDIIVEAVNEGQADLKIRIFNSETGAKDVEGNTLSGYSDTYAKYRALNGRQTKVKDLEFTGSLRREIKTIRDGRRTLLGVPSQKEREKIHNIERQNGRKIFELSKKEKENIYKRIKKNMFEDYKKIINEYL